MGKHIASLGKKSGNMINGKFSEKAGKMINAYFRENWEDMLDTSQLAFLTMY